MSVPHNYAIATDKKRIQQKKKKKESMATYVVDTHKERLGEEFSFGYHNISSRKHIYIIFTP